MKNLLTAIFAKAAGSDFMNDVGGRFYLDTAPEGAEYPYAVGFIVTDNPDYNFKSTVEDVIFQLSLFSTSESVLEIANMFVDAKALFDDCSLAITGSTLIWMMRTGLQTMIENVEAPSGAPLIKHWAVDYNIKTEI